MIETDKYGYYHATNEGGYISWYDFCLEFYRQYGLQTTVVPVSTEEYVVVQRIDLSSNLCSDGLIDGFSKTKIGSNVIAEMICNLGKHAGDRIGWEIKK